MLNYILIINNYLMFLLIYQKILCQIVAFYGSFAEF